MKKQVAIAVVLGLGAAICGCANQNATKPDANDAVRPAAAETDTATAVKAQQGAPDPSLIMGSWEPIEDKNSLSHW